MTAFAKRADYGDYEIETTGSDITLHCLCCRAIVAEFYSLPVCLLDLTDAAYEHDCEGAS